MTKRQEILDGMAAWRDLGRAPTTRSRTPQQQAWDSAVMACTEYLRRFELASQPVDYRVLHDLLTPIDES